MAGSNKITQLMKIIEGMQAKMEESNRKVKVMSVVL